MHTPGYQIFITCPVSENDPHQTNVEPRSSRVYVCVFTGLWMFLRILRPYFYRELRQKGSVVDRVLFATMGYTKETQVKLQKFSTAAKSLLNYEFFQFFYIKKYTSKINDLRPLFLLYSAFYYFVFQRLLRNPSVYFKLDADVVYFNPNVFGSMLKKKNTSDCLMTN